MDDFLGFLVVLGVVAGALVVLLLGTLVAAAVGAAGAVGVVLVQCVRAAREAFGPEADVGHLDIDPPARDAPGEPAFRSYLFGPVLRDYRIAVREAAVAAWTWVYAGTQPVDPAHPFSELLEERRRPWSTWIIEAGTGPKRLFPRLPGWTLAIPTGAALIGTLAGSVAGAALIVLTTLVFSVLLGIYLVGAGAGALLLRGFEIAILWVRGISVECVSCGRRIGVPAYDCTGCTEVPPARHRRLLPGMHGVLSRTCRCETQLPTLLIRGRWKLLAFCPHDDCHEPSPSGASPRRRSTCPWSRGGRRASRC